MWHQTHICKQIDLLFFLLLLLLTGQTVSNGADSPVSPVEDGSALVSRVTSEQCHDGLQHTPHAHANKAHTNYFKKISMKFMLFYVFFICTNMNFD